MAYDLDTLRRFDAKVDHGHDDVIEGAISEIERLRRVVDAAQFPCDICGELAVDAVDGWGRCAEHIRIDGDACRVCGNEERGQDGYLSCQCPA